MNAQDYIKREDRYGAHNYHPLPVVLDKGKGPLSGMWRANGILIFISLFGCKSRPLPSKDN